MEAFGGLVVIVIVMVMVMDLVLVGGVVAVPVTVFVVVAPHLVVAHLPGELDNLAPSLQG